MMKHTWMTTLCATIFGPSIAWGFAGIAVFEGPPGGVGAVKVYDETTGAQIDAPAELQGVRLLALDFSGRTELEEFLPGRPRWRDDIAGASRLGLPRNRGSLYRFARVQPDTSLIYGFFHIAHDGNTRSLFEVDGTGPLGQDDPFLGHVAVSPLGDAFLAATRISAGGNLFEIALDASGSVVERTSAVPPLRFSGAGLALTSTRGIGASTRGVWHFSRQAGGDATAVSFAPDVPTWFTGELATSRNGDWAVTTAGSTPSALHVYAFDASGIARRATTAPAALSGAGYLPSAQDGPYLAVADDGSMCAWRTEGFSREAFVGRTQPGAGEQPEQLSSNANFADTLDEIGTLIFKVPGQLHMAVGEQDTPGANALGRTDFFEVTLVPGAPPTFTNLSLSSGDATAPFTGAPQLEPGMMALLPDESGLVVHDDGGNNAPIYLIKPGQSGASVLLPAIKSLDLIEVAGRSMMFSVGRPNGSKPQEVYRWSWSTGGAPALVASFPEATQVVRTAPRRDGWVGFVSVALGGGERLHRAQLATGAFADLEPNASIFGPALGLSAQGSFAYSRGTGPAPATFWTWPTQGASGVALQAPATPGQILPGL